MFKSVDITFLEALSLRGYLLKFSELLPEEIVWSLPYRLQRQDSELSKVDSEIAPIREGLLKGILGEEEFSKADPKKKISEILTKEQLEKFQEEMDKELSSDVTVKLLNEPFWELLGETKVDNSDKVFEQVLGAIAAFYEEKVF